MIRRFQAGPTSVTLAQPRDSAVFKSKRNTHEEQTFYVTYLYVGLYINNTRSVFGYHYVGLFQIPQDGHTSLKRADLSWHSPMAPLWDSFIIYINSYMTEILCMTATCLLHVVSLSFVYMMAVRRYTTHKHAECGLLESYMFHTIMLHNSYM